MNKKTKMLLAAAVLIGGGYFAWKKYGKKPTAAFVKP